MRQAYQDLVAHLARGQELYGATHGGIQLDQRVGRGHVFGGADHHQGGGEPWALVKQVGFDEFGLLVAGRLTQLPGITR